MKFEFFLYVSSATSCKWQFVTFMNLLAFSLSLVKVTRWCQLFFNKNPWKIYFRVASEFYIRIFTFFKKLSICYKRGNPSLGGRCLNFIHSSRYRMSSRHIVLPKVLRKSPRCGDTRSKRVQWFRYMHDNDLEFRQLRMVRNSHTKGHRV